MKKFINYTAICFSLLIVFSSCDKDETIEESSDCKTCRALATNTKPETSKVICTPAQQEAFYSQYRDQEITCR